MTNSNEKQIEQQVNDHTAYLIAVFALTTAQSRHRKAPTDENDLYATAQALVNRVPIKCDVQTRKMAQDLLNISKSLATG